MKTLLVNLAYLDPAQIGGVGRIAHEVSRTLAAHTTPDLRIVFVVGWRFAGEFTRWVGQAVVVIPFITRHDLRLTISLLRPDVIVSPLFGIEPFTETNTVHVVGMPDALALDHPELFSEADLAYRRQVYNNLKHAFRVVTLSEHARQRIQHHTGLEADRLRVVPLGAEPQVAGQSDVTRSLPAHYVFYPANFWPHKRHDLLLRIMQRVWQSTPDLHLVLTGGRSPANQAQLRAWIDQYHLPTDHIHDLGYVTDSQLAHIYQHAQALLFVSQYEGFGMPLLEAMLHGCPVICAPLASIPEVVGDAALYVESDTPDEWAEALLSHLPAQRINLIQRGRQRATTFTWAKTGDGWRGVVAETGITFTAQAAPTTAYARLTDHMQPFLDQITRLANQSSESRWQRLIILPQLAVMQLRLLGMVRAWLRQP